MPTAGEAKLKKAKVSVNGRSKGNLSTLYPDKRTGQNKENIAKVPLAPTVGGKQKAISSCSKSNIPKLGKRNVEERGRVKKTGKVTKGKENVNKKQKSDIQKGAAKPAPDFNKIHKNWERSLAKGKAVKKKGNTKFEPFVLGENGAKQKKYAYNSEDEEEAIVEKEDKFAEDFKVDHNALQQILNNTGIKNEELASKGRATVSTISKGGAQSRQYELAGASLRTSIYYNGSSVTARKPIIGSVPIGATPKKQLHVSHDAPGAPLSFPISCSKKRVAWADTVDNEDEVSFKPDSNALHSILSNTGIDERQLNEKLSTRATLATCSMKAISPFRRMRQSNNQFTIPSPKRTSIYYTGPRHRRPRASPAPQNVNSTGILTARRKVENQSSSNVPPNQASFNPAATLVGFQGDSEEHCLSNVARNNVNQRPQSILKEKPKAKQACYTPASTAIGFQSDLLVTSGLEISKRTVEKPLLSLPKDAHFKKDETGTSVISKPRAIGTVISKPKNCTKSPETCWADVLTPCSHGLPASHMLTPFESAPAIDKKYLTEPLPMYSLEDDSTLQCQQASATPRGNLPQRGSQHKGLFKKATSCKCLNEPAVSQTISTNSLLSMDNGSRHSTASHVQPEINCRSVPFMKNSLSSDLALAKILHKAPVSSAVPKQTKRAFGTSNDIVSCQDNSTGLKGSRSTVTDVSEKESKELQALEEQVLRDLELLKEKHREIMRTNSLPSHYHGTQSIPNTYSTLRNLEQTSAENIGRVPEDRKYLLKENDENRVVAEMQKVSGEVVASQKFIRPEVGFNSSSLSQFGSKYSSSASLGNSTLTSLPYTPTPIKPKKELLNPMNSPVVSGFLSRSNTSPFRSVDRRKHSALSAREFRPIQIVSPTSVNLTDVYAKSNLSLKAVVGKMASAFQCTSSHPSVAERTSNVNGLRNGLCWEVELPGDSNILVNSPIKNVVEKLPTFVQNFTQDALLDAEVMLCINGGRILGRSPACRHLLNPLAKQFEEGDDLHFVPVND